MSEIITTVKLTNYFDIRLKEANIRSVEMDCVIDPDEVALILPERVADQLGLLVSRKQTHWHPNGKNESLAVTYSVLVELAGRRTSEEAVICGNQIRIGKTILAKTDLHIDLPNQRLIPNPAHPDQPIIKVR